MQSVSVESVPHVLGSRRAGLWQGLLLLFAWSTLWAVDAAAHASDPDGVHADPDNIIGIAVRAYRGEHQALQRWQPTAEYLTEHIPGRHFHIIPFENNIGLKEAVSRDEFDFVLTQPAAFIDFQTRYGVRPLLTLVNLRQGRGYDRFGAVIFTRAERTDITSLADLKGKSFMGVAELGFGGWMMAWRELLAAGIRPHDDFQPLMFGGGIQPNVVRAVLDGRVDAGTVRTDLLEQMAAAGELELSEIRVINSRHSTAFPFMHSTRLYPEWPLAAMPRTDPQLAQQVAVTLRAMSPLDAAAQIGSYVGWNPALDYSSVDQLLKELNSGPYAVYGDITFSKIIEDSWQWIVTAGLLAMLGCITIARMKMLNERLRATEAQLIESNRRLRSLARQDGLTGLANRRCLVEFLEQAWRQAGRNNTGMSAILFDIDYFKQYNDHYGHLAGDDCLREVARAAQEHFRRAGDLVARYGGEEFIVLLTSADTASVGELADQLRQRIASLNIPHALSDVADQVTISLGIAHALPSADSDPETLIAKADTALYEAKETGRNRAIVAA